MKAHKIKICNFRTLKDFELELKDTTVIIGENNSGKTTLLDAIRLTLSHRWGLRGTGFEEYDFNLTDAHSDPKKSEGVKITIEYEEDEVDEWPEDLVASLGKEKQLDPVTGKHHVIVQAEYKYESATENYQPTWCFLNKKGEEVVGKNARATNLSTFFNYVPVFNLSAIRDASQEFNTRSQFWGKLIKAVNIDHEKWQKISEELEKLNQELVSSDKVFSDIRSQLEHIKAVMSPGTLESVDIRALPLRIWDLISKSEILIKASEEDTYLPLGKFGQGVQSLAVINLFRAFVNNLLKEEFEEESEPMLLLEEPETHLHPQAVRALYQDVSKIDGQKLITTHSPYFLQRVPFRNIRLFRKSDGIVCAMYLQERFTVELPQNDALNVFIKKYSEKYEYEEISAYLTLKGDMAEDEKRELLKCYTKKEDRDYCHPIIVKLFADSKIYIPDNVLEDLEDNAKRIRGEIFFAKKWVFCEGQTEYILLYIFLELLGFNPDAHGVAIIDVKNNGSAGAFAALARGFGFPWIILCDGDKGGNDILKNIESFNFAKDDLKQRVLQLPKDVDIEKYLLDNFDAGILDSILKECGLNTDSQDTTYDKKLSFMRDNKTACAIRIKSKVIDKTIKTEHIPKLFVDIKEFITITNI